MTENVTNWGAFADSLRNQVAETGFQALNPSKPAIRPEVVVAKDPHTQKVIEVLLNSQHGGFRLSDVALRRFNQLRTEANLPAVDNDYFRTTCMDELKYRRTDFMLFEVLKELGSRCHGSVYGMRSCTLYVAAVPSDSDWTIIEDDGAETIQFNTSE